MKREVDKMKTGKVSLVGKALCLLCCAVMLAGCGKKKNTAQGGISAPEKTGAAVISDRLDTDNYDITLRVLGETADPVECRMVRNGDNGLVTMRRSGVYSIFYTISGESTMLLPEINCYRSIDGQNSFGNAFIKLGKDDMLYDITENKDEVTEVYKPSDPAAKETYYFTFDKATGELKKAVTESEGSETVTTNVEHMEWNSGPIELPDLTGWDDISDDASVSDVTAIKVSFYTRGITPDMVEKEGYTYEQLARMDPDETDEISRQILEKAGK